MKTNTENEWIIKLLDVTKTIEEVYDKLIEYDYQENKPKYQEWFEYLKMCLTLENKIYQEFFVSQPSAEEIERIIRKINYLFKKRTKPSDMKNKLVLLRIEAYLESKDYLNPFPSLKESIDLRIEENAEIITNQYALDYSYHMIELLNQKIATSTTKISKKTYIIAKYREIFINKLIELSLLANPLIIPKSGKERAIFLNQNEALVNALYDDLAFSQFSSILNNLIKAAKEEPTFAPKGQRKYIEIQLVSLECSLFFLTKEIIESILIKLQSLEKTTLVIELETIFQNTLSNYHYTKSKK